MASENGGLTDVALDGVTGFVVPPGDVDRLSSAILRLLNEHELAQRMETNARKRVEELFDVRKNTRKMEALLTNILGRIGFDRPPSPLCNRH